MVRIAVLGTGFIASIFMKNIATVADATVEVVLAIDDEQGKSFVEHHPVPRYVTDYQAILEDPSIDCVYVGLPNHLHFSYAKKALIAEKHVIVEKPFVTSLAEFDELMALSKEHQVFVFDAITTRHMPNLARIKDEITSIAPVRLVTTSYCQYSSKYTDYLNGQNASVFTLEGYGGALSDVGIYNMTLIVSLFGMPQTAKYYGNMMETGVDGSGVAQLDYNSFKVVALQAKDCFTENSIQIMGEKGTLVVDADPFRFTNLRRLSKNETLVLSESEVHTGMYYELTDFISIIQEKNHARAERLLEESRQVVMLMKELRLSADIKYIHDEIVNQ